MMLKQDLKYAIGIDLGGTKIELGIVDETGKIHAQQRLNTLAEQGPEAVENQILESIDLLQKQIAEPIAGIGIGVAGQIHPQTGIVIFAPNLKWHHFPLQKNMEAALQKPVRILNDVRAITLGEWMYGAGKDCRDLLCIFIGTGIGGGIVSGGHLLTGCTNTFGEIGHLTVDFHGPICTCGKRGCLEAFAGGWGIAARAQEAVRKDPERTDCQSLLKPAHDQLHLVTAKVVVEAYRLKNPMAIHIIEEMQEALIAGCASLENAYNPSRLIFGGGVVEGMPEIIDIVKEEVRRQALKAATESLEVVHAKLGKEVGVIGSAAAIFDELNKKKNTPC